MNKILKIHVDTKDLYSICVLLSHLLLIVLFIIGTGEERERDHSSVIWQEGRIIKLAALTAKDSMPQLPSRG